MFAFVKNLVGVKTDDAVNSAISTIVRLDPKAATEAELRTMEQNLDKVGTQVATAQAAYDKERKEADAIQALSARRLSAAEKLQAEMDAEQDPAKKDALGKSIATLLDQLEHMSPEVEQHLRDVTDAKDFLDNLQGAYRLAGEKLKTARADLTRAQRDMERSAQQRGQAEERAKAAAMAAGLSGATSSLGVALAAMQDTAERNRASAASSTAKAALLKPSKPEEDDPNIARAMSGGDASAVPASLSDRLAAIKAKAPGVKP